jgi:hypothetical protein
MSRLLPLVLVAGWPPFVLSPQVVTAREPTRHEQVERRLAELRKLSDADLFARYDGAVEDDSFAAADKVTRENVLVEVIRRGGRTAENWLRAKMEADYERKLKERERRDALEARHEADRTNKALSEELWESERTVRRLENNLVIFTALRRVKKKPDPLTVTVTVPKDFVATTRDLPTLEVRITNTDPEQVPLWFKFGGDYRSGRPARWRIEVTDEKGKPEAPRQWNALEGGGLTRHAPLGAGRSWDGKLPMDRFVRIHEPGLYTVRVLYHNEVTIADEDDISGLIVFESKPFTLKVITAPRQVVTLQPGDRERARAAIASLDEKGPVRVVIDHYGPKYHSFVSPTTAAGQLHDLGWRAVPTLLAALRDEKLTPGRRAWVVGLLYGISREPEMNPFGLEADWRDVVGGYEYKGVGREGSSSGGRIDVDRQKKLAARWLKFGDDYLDVREVK